MNADSAHGVVRRRQSKPRPVVRPDRHQGAGLARINSFHRDLIMFVLSWASYGGPPEEELLPRFGITSSALRQRILAIGWFELARKLGRDERELVIEAMLALQPASAPNDAEIERRRQRRNIGQKVIGMRRRAD